MTSLACPNNKVDSEQSYSFVYCLSLVVNAFENPSTTWATPLHEGVPLNLRGRDDSECPDA